METSCYCRPEKSVEYPPMVKRHLSSNGKHVLLRTLPERQILVWGPPVEVGAVSFFFLSSSSSLFPPVLLLAGWDGCSVGCGHDDGTPSRVPVGLLDDRRGVGAYDTANGHEEAVRGCAISRCSSLLLQRACNSPKGSARCSHVLTKGPHDSVGSRAISKDANSS